MFSLNGEQSSNCAFYLSIYDGLIDFSQMSPISSNVFSESFSKTFLPDPKATYCGKSLPPTYVSNSNAVTLVYGSNFYLFYQNKFLLRWSTLSEEEHAALMTSLDDGIPTDVNSTFSFAIEKGQRFNLINQNYSEYGTDIDWFVHTRSSMHLNMSVELFYFTHSTSCWYNKLVIYSWLPQTQHWETKKQICNGFHGLVEVKNTNLVRLNLQHLRSTEIGPVRPNYNITIFPVCGGTFTGPNGVISSSKDLDDFGSKHCEWTIKVREGRTIQITSNSFSVGIFTACTMDYIEIRNGQYPDSPLLTHRLCGQNFSSWDLPQTSSNYAYIIFSSHEDMKVTDVSERELLKHKHALQWST